MQRIKSRKAKHRKLRERRGAVCHFFRIQPKERKSGQTEKQIYGVSAVIVNEGELIKERLLIVNKSNSSRIVWNKEMPPVPKNNAQSGNSPQGVEKIEVLWNRKDKRFLKPSRNVTCGNRRFKFHIVTVFDAAHVERCLHLPASRT